MRFAFLPVSWPFVDAKFLTKGPLPFEIYPPVIWGGFGSLF